MAEAVDPNQSVQARLQGLFLTVARVLTQGDKLGEADAAYNELLENVRAAKKAENIPDDENMMVLEDIANIFDFFGEIVEEDGDVSDYRAHLLRIFGNDNKMVDRVIDAAQNGELRDAVTVAIEKAAKKIGFVDKKVPKALLARSIIPDLINRSVPKAEAEALQRDLHETQKKLDDAKALEQQKDALHREQIKEARREASRSASVSAQRELASQGLAIDNALVSESFQGVITTLDSAVNSSWDDERVSYIALPRWGNEPYVSIRVVDFEQCRIYSAYLLKTSISRLNAMDATIKTRENRENILDKFHAVLIRLSAYCIAYGFYFGGPYSNAARAQFVADVFSEIDDPALILRATEVDAHYQTVPVKPFRLVWDWFTTYGSPVATFERGGARINSVRKMYPMSLSLHDNGAYMGRTVPVDPKEPEGRLMHTGHLYYQALAKADLASIQSGKKLGRRSMQPAANAEGKIDTLLKNMKVPFSEDRRPVVDLAKPLWSNLLKNLGWEPQIAVAVQNAAMAYLTMSPGAISGMFWWIFVEYTLLSTDLVHEEETIFSIPFIKLVPKRKRRLAKKVRPVLRAERIKEKIFGQTLPQFQEDPSMPRIMNKFVQLFVEAVARGPHVKRSDIPATFVAKTVGKWCFSHAGSAPRLAFTQNEFKTVHPPLHIDNLLIGQVRKLIGINQSLTITLGLVTDGVKLSTFLDKSPARPEHIHQSLASPWKATPRGGFIVKSSHFTDTRKKLSDEFEAAQKAGKEAVDHADSNARAIVKAQERVSESVQLVMDASAFRTDKEQKAFESLQQAENNLERVVEQGADQLREDVAVIEEEVGDVVESADAVVDVVISRKGERKKKLNPQPRGHGSIQTPSVTPGVGRTPATDRPRQKPLRFRKDLGAQLTPSRVQLEPLKPVEAKAPFKEALAMSTSAASLRRTMADYTAHIRNKDTQTETKVVINDFIGTHPKLKASMRQALGRVNFTYPKWVS